MAITSKYLDWTRGQVEALINVIGEKNAKKLIAGEVTVTIEETALLDFVGTTTIPAATELFDVIRKFVVNTAPDAELPIYSVEGIKILLNQVYVYVESPASETRLCQQKLVGASLDRAIFKTLGRLGRLQVSLRTIYEFLKTASREHTYIFYSYGWAIYACWSGGGDGGWNFGLDSVESGRSSGDVIVYRKVS